MIEEVLDRLSGASFWWVMIREPSLFEEIPAKGAWEKRCPIKGEVVGNMTRNISDFIVDCGGRRM